MILQAAIGWTRPEHKIDYLCGGSLISRKFLITAAHCNADGNNIGPDTVRVGDTNLESPEDDDSAQQIGIARFIKHPKYRDSRNYFDIAIIELQKEVAYSRAVCSACLWREEEVPREKMDAIGFGATGFGEALSPVLQRIELAALDERDCTGKIPVNRRLRSDGLRKDQFCATGTSVDNCEGDSGGPIGVRRLGIWGSVYNFVVGIVSFGTPCAPGSTGVYTKVSAWIVWTGSRVDWIEQVTNSSFGYTGII
uniref:Uncharacterized protein n=1 Tax=Anopheles atroparvus TaxID=41427 RepID=A0A182JJV2_ANOAO